MVGAFLILLICSSCPESSDKVAKSVMCYYACNMAETQFFYINVVCK
jgi:hypothetical protein